MRTSETHATQPRKTTPQPNKFWALRRCVGVGCFTKDHPGFGLDDGGFGKDVVRPELRGRGKQHRRSRTMAPHDERLPGGWLLESAAVARSWV